MTRLVVSAEARAASELVSLVRDLEQTGVILRIGPGLLGRLGPAVAAAAAVHLPVLADARFSGNRTEVAAAVSSAASFGASWVSVDGLADTPSLESAVAAAAPYGAEILGSIAPQADDVVFGGRRGRAVSRGAVRMAEAGAVGLLGTIQDVGVAAQVAEGLEVWVAGIDDAAAARAAASRGAAAVIVNGAVGAADLSVLEALMEALGGD